MAEHRAGAVCGLLTGLLGQEPAGGLFLGAIAGSIYAVWPRSREPRFTWSRRFAGPSWTLRANHRLAAAAAARFGAAAGLVFATADAMTVGATPVITAIVVFTAAGLLASEVAWVRLRLRLALLALGEEASPLPVRLFRFLNDGTRPDRATMRSNGDAWQFRHAVIQAHLLRYARIDLVDGVLLLAATIARGPLSLTSAEPAEPGERQAQALLSVIARSERDLDGHTVLRAADLDEAGLDLLFSVMGAGDHDGVFRVVLDGLARWFDVRGFGALLPEGSRPIARPERRRIVGRR